VTIPLQPVECIGCKNDNVETLAFLNASSRFNAAYRHNRNTLPGRRFVCIRELRQHMPRGHRRYDGQ
jgi:hypothetical protein